MLKTMIYEQYQGGEWVVCTEAQYLAALHQNRACRKHEPEIPEPVLVLEFALKEGYVKTNFFQPQEIYAEYKRSKPEKG
jgi:hypothetical protein